MTVREALRVGAARLAGIEGGARDARVLLGHVMGVDMAALLREPEAVVDGGAYEAVLARRAAAEPVALIVGRAGFWTLELEVSGETLVPRGDSETVIEAAVAAWAKRGAKRGAQRGPDRGRVRRVLDLGTGTGCLLLAALVEFPEAWGLGVDLVPGAAALAGRNAVRNGLAGRAAFVVGHWAGAVEGRFDLVVSNPPYVATGELAGLMADVRLYEPASALDGGGDGLVAYRALMGALPGLLAAGGMAVFEVGVGQAEAVAGLAERAGFGVSLRRDLAGVERAVVMERVGRGCGIGAGPV